MKLPEHVSYPHTVSFEALKKDKLSQALYQRTNNVPITFPLKAKYRGTIKLHGTNATLIFRDGNTKDATYQSRNRVITKETDNQGTVALLSKVGVKSLAQEIVRISGSTEFKEIMIAGEIGGKGVQKGVAIATLDLLYCIFNIRIDGEWVDMAKYASVQIPKDRVFNIMNYPTWEVEINLKNDTKATYEKLMSYTVAVGEKCPFAASFNDPDGNPVVGNGEGIVWTLIPDNVHHPSVKSQLVNFKTKVEGFMTTAKKQKVPMDPVTAGLASEKRDRAARFVDYAVTERRLEQGVEYMREMKKAIDKANLGEYVSWVVQDTLREESEALQEMGANRKEAKKIIAEKAKKFWFDKCLEDADVIAGLEREIAGFQT